MAVIKVKVVSMFGLMADLDRATMLCGKSCYFHPDNALSFFSDTSEFSPLINEENPYAEPLQQLSDVLASFHYKMDLLSSEEVEKITMSPEDMFAYVDSLSASISQLQKEREEAQDKIRELSVEIDKISHFVGLDLDLSEIHACKYIRVRFGSLPKESYEKLNSYKQNPYIVFFPSTSDDLRYWGVYFSPIENITEVDRIFSSLYFERTQLTELTGSPESELASLQAQRDAAVKQLKDTEKRFEKLWKKELPMCQKIYSWLTERSVYFDIRRYAARYNDSFILTGWIPADKEEDFQKELDKVESLAYTFDGGEDELIHSPPVKLQNKSIFRPFEFFVDLYGLPCYDEVDPTAFVAITYFLLFGIMFGDLGQGLCVSLIGWLMWKKKKMKLGKVMVACGISAGIFGIIFGSVFGFEHALDPLYRAIGFEEKPVEVLKPETTSMIVYSAVGIGILLVILAMLVNIYSSLKRKDYGNAFFGPSGLAGLIFYSSLVVGFGGQITFGRQIVNRAFIIFFLIVPIIFMFFRDILGDLLKRKPDWKPKAWGDYIMQNFFELFEFMLSYATNTMSFLRVGAFVLVHAGMMLVVFTLAEMSSGIGYLLIVVIGNAFVMALEGLLVGIQVLRLEFYEMFSRFFDGGGRPFNPVVVRKEQ
ncbi:ATPase [Caproiciproducens galactitolivorans]|uniref:V-type ATP synthase subunit I n=1 Tax=Caproiciproducens galactitolivorans TaxID=642589 RepID=A0A4Z0YF89_9FIRM|nr:V-type ATPase 116kDa subunit family protein [Caproiciproducens galactitolivorans]QEY34255.1 ATPase [Caproiciproducens galactitolivorans]TGJ77985.1 V-type ATP synthase subunit I [Caproiciproducens galactitolivorans]